MKLLSQTVRALIAFVPYLLLFQLSGGEARQGRPGGGVAGPGRVPRLAAAPRSSWYRRAALVGSPPSERGRNRTKARDARLLSRSLPPSADEVTFARWDSSSRGRLAPQPGDNSGAAASVRFSMCPGRPPAVRKLAGEKDRQPYGLMTEAEWEYAVRRATKATDRRSPVSTGPTINFHQATTTPFSSMESAPDRHLSTEDPRRRLLHSRRLWSHDMHGNVWDGSKDCCKDATSTPTRRLGRHLARCTLDILRGTRRTITPATSFSISVCVHSRRTHGEHRAFALPGRCHEHPVRR